MCIRDKDRILDLVPFVGTHNHQVEAQSNISEQLGVSDRNLQPLVITCDLFEHGQTIVETWPCYVLFTQMNLANALNTVVNTAMIFYRSGVF